MPTIRCITGSESFREGSATFVVTVEPTEKFPLPGNTGMYISEALKQGNFVSSAARAAYLPASNNGIKDQGFYWDGSYNVPEGMILRVYGRRRHRSVSNRVTVQEGVVYIRARADGPLQRLQLKRIESGQSTSAPVYIEGRFDILSLRDVGAAKVPFKMTDLSLTRGGNVHLVMNNTVIQSATRAAAKTKVEKVRSHDGEEIAVVSTRTKRAIKL